MTPYYEHKYDLIKFKKEITKKKLLGVEDDLIYLEHTNTSKMSKLFSKLYDQYSYVFSNYVNQTVSPESAEIL